MTQPGSATVMTAASSVSADGAVARTSTGRDERGCTGAAISTPTSTSTSAPRSRSVTRAGSGVLTAGPSTVTSTAWFAGTELGPSLTSRTLMSCSGRAAVPRNRSVESTPLIRMCSMLARGRAQLAARLDAGRRHCFRWQRRSGALLLAAFLEEQVIAIRSPGVQDPVLPVRARRHQFLAVADAGLGEPLLGQLEIANAELPGQNLVRPGRRELLPPLDAKFDLAVTKR